MNTVNKGYTTHDVMTLAEHNLGVLRGLVTLIGTHPDCFDGILFVDRVEPGPNGRVRLTPSGLNVARSAAAVASDLKSVWREFGEHIEDDDAFAAALSTRQLLGVCEATLNAVVAEEDPVRAFEAAAALDDVLFDYIKLLEEKRGARFAA